MNISRLEIKKYRNYQSVDISFDKKVNLFLGKNGSGKTILLNLISQILDLNYSLLDLSNGCDITSTMQAEDSKSFKLRIYSAPMSNAHSIQQNKRTSTEDIFVSNEESTLTDFSITIETFTLENTLANKIELTNNSIDILFEGSNQGIQLESPLVNSISEIHNLTSTIIKYLSFINYDKQKIGSLISSLLPSTQRKSKPGRRHPFFIRHQTSFTQADFGQDFNKIASLKQSLTMQLTYSATNLDRGILNTIGFYNNLLFDGLWEEFSKGPPFEERFKTLKEKITDIFNLKISALENLNIFFANSRIKNLRINIIQCEVKNSTATIKNDPLPENTNSKDINIEYQILFVDEFKNISFFNELTPGEQRYFSLCLRNTVSNGNYSYIDELENGFHPTWINSVYSNNENQLLLTTHNPFVVDLGLQYAEEDSVKEQSVLHICYQDETGFNVKNLEKEVLAKLEKLINARRSPSQALFQLGIW